MSYINNLNTRFMNPKVRKQIEAAQEEAEENRALFKPPEGYSEHEDCCQLKKHLDKLVEKGKIICYTHVSNETYTKSWNQKAKLRDEGVHSGVPDYIIVAPTKVIFLEMKREKGGVVSDTQKEWLAALSNKTTVTGVSYGYEAAKNYLKENL